MPPVAQELETWFAHVEKKAFRTVGGESRLKVIIILACVLGLDSADKVTIGAISGQLVTALNISYVQVGLLVTVSTGIGALATLPIGILVDRVNRTLLLTISIIIWGVCMVISGFANSYLMLLLTRLGLGAVVATATPVIASLTGDYFRPGVRGRIWGYILSGELIGAGVGIIIAGEAAAVFSWRASFWVLAATSLIVAAAVWRWLPEPARGTQSHLAREKEKIPSTKKLQKRGSEDQKNDELTKQDEVKEEIEENAVEPHESMILKKNPAKMPFMRAVRYILSIRTNVVLILSSAFGYFFYTGVRTFAIIFIRGRFNLGQSAGKLIVVAIGLGAILGVLITGRLSDELIERGYISARISVAGSAFFITVILFLVALFMHIIYIAVPIFFLAAVCFGGTNSPIDAARLDVMHSRLWGRAESVRATLRYLFEAAAPITFGFVASFLGANGSKFGVSHQNIENVLPLAHTFMIMLVPILIAAAILFVFYWRYNSYPKDVATVIASEKETRDED